LYDNNLSVLPASIGNLKNLKKLDLMSNALTSLPESFYGLSLLKELYLLYNPLPALTKERVKQTFPFALV
jgi:internalin A